MTVSGSPRTLPHKTPRVEGGYQLEDRRFVLLGSELYYDEFDDGKIDAGWTKVDNSGHTAPTWTETNGCIGMAHTTGTDNGPGGHYLVRDISGLGGPPLMIETCVRGMIAYNTSYIMSGLAFRSGTTWGSGTQVVHMPYTYSGGGAGMRQSLRLFTNDTGATQTNDSGLYLSPNSRSYLRLYWGAANTFNSAWSIDGINWFTLGEKTMTTTPAYAGLYLSNWGTTQIFTASYDYFRVYDTFSPTYPRSDTL